MKILAKAKCTGFTIIELMVTVSIIAIIATMAMPSFTQMMRNYELRAVAESVANGLQRARAEAVSRNASVQFVLGTGTAWTVDYVTKPVSTDPPLDQRASNESSPNTTLTAVAADGTTAATTITFNNLGQVVANTPASATLAKVTFNAALGSQPLWVVVGVGGNAKVCDPSLPATNIRSCSHA